jgi:hypothetical protein
MQLPSIRRRTLVSKLVAILKRVSPRFTVYRYQSERGVQDGEESSGFGLDVGGGRSVGSLVGDEVGSAVVGSIVTVGEGVAVKVGGSSGCVGEARRATISLAVGVGVAVGTGERSSKTACPRVGEGVAVNPDWAATGLGPGLVTSSWSCMAKTAVASSVSTTRAAATSPVRIEGFAIDLKPRRGGFCMSASRRPFI